MPKLSKIKTTLFVDTKKNEKQNKRFYICPHQHQHQINEPNQNNNVMDLSGYLIFITTNHNGGVRVYGKHLSIL